MRASTARGVCAPRAKNALTEKQTLFNYLIVYLFYTKSTSQGRSQDFQEGGGFQIGSNENGWSKILTLRTYKTLAFTLRKQKTPWLPLSERVYHFLDIYVSVVIDVQTLARLTWSTSGMFLTFLKY